MRKHLIFLFFVFSICSAVIAAEPSTNHYAILPASEGPALLKQCSRSSPPHVTNYWTPSASQIAALEKLLPEFLRKSGFKRQFSKFNCQYAGITTDGKQLIYLNAFPLHVVEDSKYWRTNWRTKALIVCDGGEAFWGIVFDPADNSFHEFSTNGIA